MWQLMNVDVDRPLLRDALRGDLPTSVIERRDKSSQSASWIIGLRRYADAARDLIGDGICARVGAIDVDEAIRALDGVVVGDHSRIGVLELLAVERWLQLWQPLRSGGNLLERFVAAAHAYCTLGEIADVLREEFGRYKEPKIL